MEIVMNSQGESFKDLLVAKILETWRMERERDELVARALLREREMALQILLGLYRERARDQREFWAFWHRVSSREARFWELSSLHKIERVSKIFLKLLTIMDTQFCYQIHNWKEVRDELRIWKRLVCSCHGIGQGFGSMKINRDRIDTFLERG